MVEYPLIDTQGRSHALLLQDDRLLLDQQPVLTIQQAAVIVFVIGEGQEEVACTPQACWDAFAGVGAIPTAAEAGRLLAHHLAHWIDEQRLRGVLQAFSHLIADQAPPLLLPQRRLDPFIEAALARCEPTPTLAKVEALAQVLDQPPAQIAAWLRQRGKTVRLPEDPPQPQEGDDRRGPGADAPGHEGAATSAKRLKFHWTSQMIEQLSAAFLSTPADQSIRGAAKAIAEQQSWPVECVVSKLYQLALPRKREARPSPSTSPEVDGEQVETPVPGKSVERAGGQDAPKTAVNPSQTLLLAESEAAAPLELCRGNFVWDVCVDDRRQRWFLDYPYGDFPVRKGLVVYQGATYALQLVGSNTLRASSLQQTIHEETKPTEVLNVG